jgi:hypothetical protein
MAGPVHAGPFPGDFLFGGTSNADPVSLTLQTGGGPVTLTTQQGDANGGNPGAQGFWSPTVDNSLNAAQNYGAGQANILNPFTSDLLANFFSFNVSTLAGLGPVTGAVLNVPLGSVVSASGFPFMTYYVGPAGASFSDLTTPGTSQTIYDNLYNGATGGSSYANMVVPVSSPPTTLQITLGGGALTDLNTAIGGGGDAPYFSIGGGVVFPNISAVPEPSSFALGFAGAVGSLGLVWRTRRNSR